MQNLPAIIISSCSLEVCNRSPGEKILDETLISVPWRRFEEQSSDRMSLLTRQTIAVTSTPFTEPNNAQYLPKSH